MHSKLAHLTSDQIASLMDRYYAGEGIKSLLQEFNIHARVGELIKFFPEQDAGVLCRHCGKAMKLRYMSRSNRNQFSDPECPACGHHEGRNCWCDPCRTEQQSAEEKKRLAVLIEAQKRESVLQELLRLDNREFADLSTLSFTERVYLGAFLREGIDEDFNLIKPLIEFENPLAPTQAYEREIVKSLQEKNIIAIHPDSDSKCFSEVDGDTGAYRYIPARVKWALTVKDEQLNKVPLVNSLVAPADFHEPEAAFEMWKTIALHEALEYLIHSVQETFNIEYTVGDKSIAVINDLLQFYSVSQIYAIFYRSTSQAARFLVEKKVTKQHAANSIIGSAHSYADRARANNWDIKRYRRNFDCPESALSKFFFERILKIGHDGFDQVPRLIEQISNQ